MRGEGGRQGSRGAWGKACARVGAIHGVGGGSGGCVRRRRAAGAVGCHPEVVCPAKAAARWQQLWQKRQEAGAGGGVAAGDGAMASRGVVLCVCLMSVY